MTDENREIHSAPEGQAVTEGRRELARERQRGERAAADWSQHRWFRVWRANPVRKAGTGSERLWRVFAICRHRDGLPRRRVEQPHCRRETHASSALIRSPCPAKQGSATSAISMSRTPWRDRLIGRCEYRESRNRTLSAEPTAI